MLLRILYYPGDRGMNEKIIEKTYKYTIPTPKELFESFCVEFSNTTLPDIWVASRPWTDTLLGIFDSIGRSLGYIPKREWLALDQTWEIRHPDISVVVLALEHENTHRVEDVLDDELQKLLDVKAFLKVLVFYPLIPVVAEGEEFSFPEIQGKIRSAKIKNPDERYAVMSITRISDKTLEVTACSLDPDGKAEELGPFQVKYTSKD